MEFATWESRHSNRGGESMDGWAVPTAFAKEFRGAAAATQRQQPRRLDIDAAASEMSRSSGASSATEKQRWSSCSHNGEQQLRRRRSSAVRSSGSPSADSRTRGAAETGKQRLQSEQELVGDVSGLVVALLSKLVRVSQILGTNLEKILN